MTFTARVAICQLTENNSNNYNNNNNNNNQYININGAV